MKPFWFLAEQKDQQIRADIFSIKNVTAFVGSA
jgi:hypothetical protein